MIIRSASEEDIKSLCELEAECFSMPWTESGFKDFFANEYSRCFVAEDEGKLCGYVGMYLISGEAEITNLAVFNAFRRRGIGGLLIEAVCSECGVERVLLDVRESNTAARKLYEKHGFQIDGKRRGFYSKPREDAILMSLDISKRIR